MKLKKTLILLSVLLTLLFAGCGGTPEGKVHLKVDRDDMIIKVDGIDTAKSKWSGVDLTLKEGTHEITVEEYSKDGNWVHRGKAHVTVSGGLSQNKSITVRKYMTQKAKDAAAQIAETTKKEVMNKFNLKEVPKEVFFASNSNLTWQDNIEVKDYTYKKNWEDSKEYCENLTLSGIDDWRLPSNNELLKGGKHKKDFKFINISTYYWSSTNAPSKPNTHAIAVAWNVVSSHYHRKTILRNVRCVR